MSTKVTPEIYETGRQVFRRAIALVVAHPAPDQIPLSGDRVLARDYLIGHLSGLDPEGEVLVGGMSHTGVTGRVWGGRDAGGFVEAVTVPYERAKRASVEFSIYLRRHDFRENSAFALVLKHWARWYRFRVWWNEARLAYFYKRNLPRVQRIAVLKRVFALNSDLGRSVGTVLLLASMDGVHVVLHPAFPVQQQRLRLVPDSLVESQLLVCADGGYRVLPRALEFIENYEADIQRYLQQTNSQRLIVVFTMVSAIATAAQAYFAAGGSMPRVLISKIRNCE